VAHGAHRAVDTEIGGKSIKAGERVAMWYISGNRDEEVIPNANTFTIDRPNVRHHLSFGSEFIAASATVSESCSCA
jgi:cytochrome P450